MGRGLSTQQWRILGVLAQQGGCASHRMVAHKAVTPAAPTRIAWKGEHVRVMSASQRVTLHRSVARLLARGLVQRGDVYNRIMRAFGKPLFAEDGYILTDAGREVLSRRGVDVNAKGNFLTANDLPRATENR